MDHLFRVNILLLCMHIEPAKRSETRLRQPTNCKPVTSTVARLSTFNHIEVASCSAKVWSHLSHCTPVSSTVARLTTIHNILVASCSAKVCSHWLWSDLLFLPQGRRQQSAMNINLERRGRELAGALLPRVTTLNVERLRDAVSLRLLGSLIVR